MLVVVLVKAMAKTKPKAIREVDRSSKARFLSRLYNSMCYENLPLLTTFQKTRAAYTIAQAERWA